MRSHLLIATVALGSGAVGVFVGYKIAEKRLGAAFDERLDKETADMKEYYQLAKKPFATPQEAAAVLIAEPEPPEEETPAEVLNERVAYHKIVKSEYQTSQESQEEEVVEGEYGPEQPPSIPRDLTKPHIITQEEFLENETEWNQVTLEWYAEDGILADDRDTTVDDPDKVIGLGNIDHFGMNSSDPNIVHIRNPAMELEIELTFNPGSFRKLILGEENPPPLPSGRPRP